MVSSLQQSDSELKTAGTLWSVPVKESCDEENKLLQKAVRETVKGSKVRGQQIDTDL